VRIERERNIVFPETTIIIRDIQKLTDEISKGGIKKESDYLTAEDIINHE